MKFKRLLATLAFSLTLGVGVFAGIKANKVVKEADAAEPTRVYCKCTQSWWTKDGAAIGIYAWKDGGGTNASWPGARMNSLGDGLWYYDIDTTTYPKVIFTRVNGGTGSVSDYGAKTGDLSFNSTSNYYTITSTSAVWGDPGVAGNWADSNYNHLGDNLSITFYASSAGNNGEATPNVHVWGNNIVSPVTNWPGASMTKTSEDVNFLGSSLYKMTINYKSYWSDRGDVSVNMIINNDGDYDKTADITIIVDGAYYSPTNGWWNQGYTADASKGAAAKVAFDVSDIDVCNLTDTSVAESIRDGLENASNATHLSTTTWNGSTYDEALKLVDSKCSTHKYSSNISIASFASKDNSAVTIVIILSSISMIALGGFLFAKKKKEI